MRKTLLFAIAITILTGVVFPALGIAQTFPAKTVRIVVPFPPGGPADVLGRMLGQKLAERWSQPVVIDNRGGAAGNIGAEFVARSAADGYTLLLNATSHVVNGSMYSKLSFDPIKDFTPVTEVASYMLVLVVHPSVPVTSLAQFVALAKARPGQISVANTGAGTPTQLAAELFKSAAGINLLQVPYKGAAPANTDLLGGQVIAMFNNPINALPFARAGKLRALAVTGTQRLSIAPELPTIAESGYPNFEAGTWYGFFGPAQLPAEIVAKIHSDVVAVLRLADIQQKLAAQGWDSIGNSPAEFTAVIKSDFEKWARVVKAAGLRAD
jgi:tripartite-type tricarboxylate transporter receptor subunit TctC